MKVLIEVDVDSVKVHNIGVVTLKDFEGEDIPCDLVRIRTDKG